MGIPTGEIASEIAPATISGTSTTETPYEWVHLDLNINGRHCESIHTVKMCKHGYSAVTYQPQEVELCCTPNCVHKQHPTVTPGNTSHIFQKNVCATKQLSTLFYNSIYLL